MNSLLTRRLKITTTVIFGGVAIALTMFWVRSYLVEDYPFVSVDSHTYYAESRRGNLRFGISERGTANSGWKTQSVASYRPGPLSMGIRWTRVNLISYWQLIIVATVFASLPWLPFRYSLRTLLLITTLVALFIASFL